MRIRIETMTRMRMNMTRGWVKNDQQNKNDKYRMKMTMEMGS